MSTFTLSIGRRIGTGENLPRDQWIRFQARIEGAIEDLPEVTIYFAGRGGGIYEGVYEESATWVFEAPELTDRFRRDVAYWAGLYGQECVALTEGQTSFIEARKPRRAAEVAA